MASKIPGLKFSFEVFLQAIGEGRRQRGAVQNTDTGTQRTNRGPEKFRSDFC